MGLSKEQILDTVPETIHQINFTGNLTQARNIFFILEQVNYFGVFRKNSQSFVNVVHIFILV